MNKLEDEQSRDMQKYHDELETFLEVTGITSDRSGSTRAQKARGKLFKLSNPQFYELSTDVDDELRRRLDEAQDQPEHLLPKASFHYKRNQAREKLSNLTQPRFCDLVNDILFEIKRRGFDKKDIDINTEPESNKSVEVPESQNDERTSPLPPTSTLQTSHIFAKRASLTWSSDEEGEDDNTEEQGLNENNVVSNKNIPVPEEFKNTLLETPTVIDSNLSDNGMFKPPSAMNTDQNTTASPSYSLFSPVDKYYAFNDTEGHSQSPNELDNVPYNSNTDTQEPEYIPENQLGGLSENAAEAEAEVEVEEETGPEREAEAVTLPATVPITTVLNKEINDHKSYSLVIDKAPEFINNESDDMNREEFLKFNSQISTLSIENELLKQRISELEISSKRTNNSTVCSSVNANRNPYEQSQTLLNEESLQTYVDENGSISLHLVIQINNILTNFFKFLNKNVEDVGDNLFEILLQISNKSKEVMDLVNVTEFKDEITVLKACLSHLISTLRFYLIYGNLLPKITVQASVSELSFALCKLISSAKIKKSEGNASPIAKDIPSDDGVSISSDTETTFNDIKSNSSAIQSHLNSVQEDISPVKPLKITQKINRDLANTTPSIRKPNSTGLFSSMIDTRSPRVPSTKEQESIKNEVEEHSKYPKIGLGISHNDDENNLIKTEIEVGSKSDMNDRAEKVMTNKSLNNPSSANGSALPITNLPSILIASNDEPIIEKNMEAAPEAELTINKDTNSEEIEKKTDIEDNKEDQINQQEVTNATESSMDEKLDSNVETVAKDTEKTNEDADDISFEMETFDIENPDNTLADLLYYVEHQTVDVISSIQSLLQSIKEPNVTRGSLREDANSISTVITQIVNATSISMKQTRNSKLQEHGDWIVQSLDDCIRRITTLCELNENETAETLSRNQDLADKQYKQRLAGIAFDIAKCTKELVKSVEQAN